jgi:hypothetical protein
MTELPKSVRDGLARAQTPATSHPDADLLTAYSEDSLGATERQRVTEHVAACAECREVLFLAQPDVEQEQIVAKPVAARRFAWMAWASVAAVIVVVGSAVVMRQEKAAMIEPPTTLATATKPSDAPQREKDKITEYAPAAKVPARTREEDKLAIVRPPASPLPTGGTPVKEPATRDEKKKDESPNPAGLSANESAQQNMQGVIAGKQFPSGPANSANSNVANVYTAQNTAPVPAPAQKVQRKAEAAHDAIVPRTAFGYSMDEAARQELGRAHWRISKAGGLERSYINDDWKPVSVGAGTTFRVISVVGNVVWAGGNHGALYVSRNGGIDWAPVKFDGTTDIISIHFDDELNGKIQTSEGKTWKTTDAGNIWTSQ